MINEVLEQIKRRRNFYRNNYHRMSSVLMVCMMVIIFEVAAIFLVKLTQTPSDFYTTNPDGGIKRIYPAEWGARITQPNQGDVNLTAPVNQ
ncbi:MAG: hypothetical protein AB7F64_00625 [Gammaproteobacteria bacterium]